MEFILYVILICSIWQPSYEHAIILKSQLNQHTQDIENGALDSKHDIAKRQVDENLALRVSELEERFESVRDEAKGDTGATGARGPRGRDVGARSNIVKYVRGRMSNLEGELTLEKRDREAEVNELKNEVAELTALFRETEPVFRQCHVENGGCAQLCFIGEGGSARCGCTLGYQLQDNGVSCQDINECLSQADPCRFECGNTDGSYQCICPGGYILQEDSITCQDIDECSLPISNCEQLCFNNDGGYECGCYEGIPLHEDGRSCTVNVAN